LQYPNVSRNYSLNMARTYAIPSLVT
jgi:hypothetical protein